MTLALRQLVRSLKYTLPRPSTPGTRALPQNGHNDLPFGHSHIRFYAMGHAATGFAGKKTAKGKVGCSCGDHPWPVEEHLIVEKKEKIDCDFDFKKLEVNPFDIPCDCVDPPPAAGCADIGRPKEVCCRTTRQYGCHCEEEEESECEEMEEEEVVVNKTCDLDFRKLEVNPYDDPCECHDPPPAHSCESLKARKDTCCRTPKPFSCHCEAYDQPGLECFKEKAKGESIKKKKDCNKKENKAKCL